MAINQDERVLLALGSNLGDRLAHLRQAIQRLAYKGITIVTSSSVYETPPMYNVNQPSYLNMAIEVRYGGTPPQLLLVLKALEKAAGRTPSALRNQARPLDIDIILFGDRRLESETLTIPHPEFHKRDFVLIPAAEIAPEWIAIGFNQSLQSLLLLLPSNPTISLVNPPITT